MRAAISRLGPLPCRPGQRFGGVAIGDTARRRALDFATALHAEYSQYVGRPWVAATGDGGIALRWRRTPSGSAEPIDIELVFVDSEIEYAITPAGNPEAFLDEGSTDRIDAVLREVVKRHVLA
jgi:hypothetical protein